MNQFQRYAIDTLMGDVTLFDMQTSMKNIVEQVKTESRQSIDKETAKKFLKKEIGKLNDKYSSNLVSINETSSNEDATKKRKEYLKLLSKSHKNLDANEIKRVQSHVDAYHKGNFFFAPQYEENIIEQINPILTNEEFISKYADAHHNNILMRELVLKTYVKSRLSSMLRNVETVDLETKIHAISKSTRKDIDFTNPEDRIRSKDVEFTMLQGIDVKKVLAEYERLYTTEEDIDKRNKGFNLKYKFANHKFEDIELLASRFDIRLIDAQKNEFLGAIKSRLKRSEDELYKRVAEMLSVRDDNAYDDFGTIELYPSFKNLYEALPEISRHRDSRKYTKTKFYGLPQQYDEELIKEHLIQAYTINSTLSANPRAEVQKKQKDAMISQVQLKGLIQNLRIENNLQVGGFMDLINNDNPITNTSYSSLPRSILSQGYTGDVHNEIYNGPVLAHKKYMLRRETNRENDLKDHNLVETAKLFRKILEPIYKVA